MVSREGRIQRCTRKNSFDSLRPGKTDKKICKVPGLYRPEGWWIQFADQPMAR